MQHIQHQFGNVARNVQLAFLGIKVGIFIFHAFFITNPDGVGVFGTGSDHPFILGCALRNIEFQTIAAPVRCASLAVNRIAAF